MSTPHLLVGAVRLSWPSQIENVGTFDDVRYMGGISILRDYLLDEKMRPKRAKEAFLRLDFAPGECAQVDWGEFGDVFGDGIKIHCLPAIPAEKQFPLFKGF